MRNNIIIFAFLLAGICLSLFFIMHNQRGEDIQEEKKEIQTKIIPIEDPNLEMELENIETDIFKMPGIVIYNADGTQSIVAQPTQEGLHSRTVIGSGGIEFQGKIIDNGDGTQTLIAE